MPRKGHPGINPALEPRVGVFGMGNILMGDDALGPTVIAYLKSRFVFPSEVRVEDLGTPGLDLYSEFAPLQSVVLVDTVRDDGSPGTVRAYSRADILRHPPGHRVGPHDPGLKETLLMLQLAGVGPKDLTLIGVVPGAVDYEVGLTPEVAAAVPGCVELAVQQLARLGVVNVAPQAQPVNLWWTSPPAQAQAR